MLSEPHSNDNLEALALAVDCLHRLVSCRYAVRPKTYTKRDRTLRTISGFYNGLPVSTEEVRLNAEEFQDLLERVKPHWPRSKSGRGRKQAPIDLQLACFLYRLAHKSMPFHRVADKFNISRK